MRHQVVARTASTIQTHLCTPGSSMGTYTTAPVLSSSPLYTAVLHFPCRYGLLWSNFQGAGDVITMHLIVREYRC